MLSWSMLPLGTVYSVPIRGALMHLTSGMKGSGLKSISSADLTSFGRSPCF